MKKAMFEQMGGTYTQQGDYLLPDFTLPPQETRSVGIWGQQYRRWLKENHRVLYYNLLASGKLSEQVAEADERAENLFSRLIQKMAEREGVTEALKAADPMAWVRRMNNIRQRATEIVNNDLIYA